VKFLIDECLSPKLVKLAQDKGYGESTHVAWRKLAGKKDWELKPIILDGDWTFVTRNSVDFRGPSSKPEKTAHFTFTSRSLCKTSASHRRYGELLSLTTVISVFGSRGKEISTHGRLAQNKTQVPSQSRSIH